ncbi:phosphodiester glycosidase family protein [Thermomonospora umbrina]|uniref:Calcineurin-like phosphoesterase family protein n=1 Tax=Thermomonospora umbrina TaxID=111806 RepID=A0A3D9T2T6_9ACTN|nr:phosphodiester glycosidase family protein [Thermomonospora umbrina]REF01161.1 calcineurin-like phosphoesterase family protein [Thermomonospora umbrina]
MSYRRIARPAVVLGLASVLVAGTALPALAGPPGPGGTAPPLVPADPAAPGLHDLNRLMLAAPGSTADRPLETDRRTRPVAPGTTLTSFDRLDGKGWLRADLLSVDLGGGKVRAGYLSPGPVSAVEPLSGQADRAGAIAGVNGDFFDINNTGAPNGAAVKDGRLVKSATPGWSTNTAGVSAEGLGQIAQMLLEGEVTLPGDRKARLDQFNAHFIQKDGIGAFTSLWGTGGRGRSLAQGAQRMAEVLVVDGKVAEVRDAPGAGGIPANGFVLVGREGGGDLLRTLKAGDAVSLTYAPRSSVKPAAFAVGGNQTLVKDGEIPAITDPAEHPRTAVGFSADGRRMFLMTVDGRQIDSRGVTLTELAGLMKEAGAHNALNLDGGGSSTMLARKPGQGRGRIENRPSDGGERPTPNGIGLFSNGSGRLTGFWVEPAADPAQAPGVGPTRGGRPDRVFPGLTRELVATGHDESHGPAKGTPRWTVTGPQGSVDDDGTFRARRPGDVTVVASRGAAKGRVKLTVLGALTRVGATVDRVTIPNDQTTGAFGVVGFDADGFTAPVEPADARLTYDTTLLEITPGEGGTFAVKPLKTSGSTLVTIEVKGRRTALPISVGLEQRTIATFDDGDRWRFGTARASGDVEPVSDGRTGPGLRLSYDFTKSTATRTAYAYPPEPIQVQGQPQALGAWVYGHNKGEWTAFTITDANNQSYSLYGPYIRWEGWRYVEMAVPSSVAYPIRVNRFYTIETAANRQYTGEVLIDDIVAKVPPSVETPPPAPRTPDPLVVQDGTVNGRKWRFAVLSDAQFVAADPDSAYVERARRTLREVKAAEPDFLVINGDFVDTGYEADFALAKKILDEELGGALPYHYVPGNHEIYGPGNIANFRKVFGEPFRTFDHKGTRFVLLDSSTGTYRTSSFEQLRMLRRALDDARGDASIGSVTVFGHHPSRDPLPSKNSRLADRKEAALIEGWLADFRTATGKGAAVVNAHVGVFNASRVDGVHHFINGDSGKNPAAGAADGGFTGWTMFGVDPLTREAAERDRHSPFRRSARWLHAEVRPHVDELTVDAPERLAPGGSARVTATLRQHGRDLPLAYPMSADWSASPSVHIGDPDDARPWHVAVFDPATGTLKARRDGTITLSVTVNGTARRATITLTKEERPAA